MARKPASTVIDISHDTERLARELCAYAGHNPDALVFPGTPETIRTTFDKAYIIPPAEKLIAAWELFQFQALAVKHLKINGLLG